MQDSKLKLTGGFTLVEIMIALSIVAVLLTLAIPNLLRSRIVANEIAALANIKTISDASQLYYINEGKYPENLLSLAESNLPYIDDALASGEKQGYEFIYNHIDTEHFTINANPLPETAFKGRYFYTDETGIIRVKEDGPAGPEDEIFR